MHQLLVHFFYFNHWKGEGYLKKQLAQLIELQKVELEINKANLKCQNLPKEIEKLEEAFAAFQSEVEGNRAAFEDVRKAHREKEEKLKASQEALKRTKTRLSEVKTNKEYQSVLKEIETAESKSGEAEDQIILLLEAVDAAKESLKIKEKELESFKQSYEDKKKKLEAELSSLDGVLASCRQKSKALKGHLTADLLKRYEAIKKLHNNHPVAAVWKEVCEGCHMNIPPQLYIELQKAEELHVCPNCNRVIYWYDQNKEKI